MITVQGKEPRQEVWSDTRCTRKRLQDKAKNIRPESFNHSTGRQKYHTGLKLRLNETSLSHEPLVFRPPSGDVLSRFRWQFQVVEAGKPQVHCLEKRAYSARYKWNCLSVHVCVQCIVVSGPQLSLPSAILSLAVQQGNNKCIPPHTPHRSLTKRNLDSRKRWSTRHIMETSAF